MYCTLYILLIVVVAAEETTEIHGKQLKDSNFPFKYWIIAFIFLQHECILYFLPN